MGVSFRKIASRRLVIEHLEMVGATSGWVMRLNRDQEDNVLVVGLAVSFVKDASLQMLACKCKLQTLAANACLQMQAANAGCKCLLANACCKCKLQMQAAYAGCKCLLANARCKCKVHIADASDACALANLHALALERSGKKSEVLLSESELLFSELVSKLIAMIFAKQQQTPKQENS
ncbi:hypothetical protein Tco_1334992 [Tanacetum coccineum]